MDIIPNFILSELEKYLSQSQLLTLQILIWLLQVHKDVKIERLAACLPLPILYESRRKHLKRFLVLKKLSVTLIWLPIIKAVLDNSLARGSKIVIVLDRTQWKNNNLLMVSVVWKKRALPVYWNFLDKKGSTNINEKIAILKPVIKLLKHFQIVVIGDREFGCVQFAYWLKRQKIRFALRVKQGTNIRKRGGKYQTMDELGLKPGLKIFYSHINYTKKKGFGEFNLAAYWKRKYKGKVDKEGWFILTNLENIDEVIKIFKQRSGIEAMFKDCKTGGYNLEGSRAKTERLTRLVLLIAIAYTTMVLQGKLIKNQGQQKYIARLKENKRNGKRHSNFWVGLYGYNWIITWEFCYSLVNLIMKINSHKSPYYQQGMKAMDLIKKA